MFGTFRTILAALVVLDHFGGLPFTSTPMVFGFFCLSGFLMTMLMDGDYKGRIPSFFLNRFLRIFPIYWATIAGLWWYIGAWPPLTGPFVRQLFMINLWPETPFAIQVAWAITTELVFYILIGFGFSKTLERSAVWLAASATATVAVFAYLSIYGGDFQHALYLSIWAGSLPFALGAVVYHMRHRLVLGPAWLGAGGAALIATTVFASYAFKQWEREDLMMVGVFASLIGHTIILLALYRMRKTKADDLIGRFSYPIYLVHVPVFGILLDRGLNLTQSVYGFACTLAFSVVLSAVFLIAVDQPVQMIRKIVRSRQRTRLAWPVP
jgi:peptidoglycan/LPS O-acetylase OafA/YrhL